MKNQSKMFTIGLVSAWYSSNIGVLLLNKYLLSNYGFKYPIFLTMCHMTACSLLSYIAIAWMKMVPMQTIRSRVQFFKITTLSLVFCVSVVFGNISLRYLPVSFNQAVGATTPFFTAVFAYLMTLKREGWLTYITLVPVVTGVIIASGLGAGSGVSRLRSSLLKKPLEPLRRAVADCLSSSSLAAVVGGVSSHHQGGPLVLTEASRTLRVRNFRLLHFLREFCREAANP
ncbi:hypothetical protein Gotur_018746 [Gossypium turneri]